MARSKDILFVGDPHAHPSYSNSRFTLLGKYIRKHRPAIVVCAGDWGDMPSICAQASKQELRGKTIRRDLDAANEALDMVTHETKGIRGIEDWWMLGGNHEIRVQKEIDDNPKLEGLLSMDDFQFRENRWKTVPFQTTHVVQGFAFSHYFPSGNLGKAIGGVNIGRTMVLKNHESGVQGHNHTLDFSRTVTPSGRVVNCMTGGCYASPKMKEAWNLNTEHFWWRGVVWLRNARAGDASISMVRMGDM